MSSTPEPKKTESKKVVSFETGLSQLETIVQSLEEGQIPLAEALACYEQGIKLLKHCYQSLEQAERRIEQLSSVDSAGIAVCEPFDDAATSLDEKAQSRGRKRSRTVEPNAPSDPDTIDGPGRLF